MFKKKSNEKNTYGIVGLGRFGHALALELAAAGAELVVLDKEEERCGSCGSIQKMLT